MQLTKFFVVFVTLVGRICVCKIVIETNKSNGLAELEAAAIKILSNCYANQDKTIVLAGDIPGSFIKKLSFQPTFSMVLLDHRRKTKIDCYWASENPHKVYKVHILVAMAPHYLQISAALNTFTKSRYGGTTAFVLMLGWSPENKYAGCEGNFRTSTILISAQMYNMPSANLLCRDIKKGIVIYSFSAFPNSAPKPWQLVFSLYSHNVEHIVFYFMREYREHADICENLFFKKINNMNKTSIKTINRCNRGFNCSGILVKNQSKNKHLRIEYELHFGFIRDFFMYINATEKPIWQKIVVGKVPMPDWSSILTTPIHMRGLPWNVLSSYPYGIDCKFLVTQFRGHKSQLQKIYDVIDKYSWTGMWVVYLITILFFKYFLRQPLTVAILNLCRLTCNFGLRRKPMNVVSQIYLSCLLFFMLTMLGIFTSSMASVLTLDVPVRQVNSIQDLADLGYTVYVDKSDFIHFTDLRFKGRLILRLPNEDCIQYIKRDASFACLTWSASDRTYAANSKLHLSDCIANEYITIIIPRNWALQEHLDNFVGVKKSGGIMTDLDVLVDEKMLLEAELEEEFIEPKIITLTDVGFAFVILGVGLGCAIVSFIVEIMIYRCQRRVTTTRKSVIGRSH